MPKKSRNYDNRLNYYKSKTKIKQPVELRSKNEHKWSKGSGNKVWTMLSSAITGDLAMIKKLIKIDPHLVSCNFQYRTPLHFAVQRNHIKIVKFLLKHGADPTYVSGNYWHAPPIIIAKERRHTELYQIISDHCKAISGVVDDGEKIAQLIKTRDTETIRNTLDLTPSLVTASDLRGNQPIHWAVMIRSIPIIDLVLEKGGDINSMRPDGARPLDLSNGDYFHRGWRDVPKDAISSHDVLIGYLIAKGADYDISVAAKVGDTERVRELLRENPSLANKVPPYSTYYSGLPLRNACARGDLETVQVLLEAGADPNTPEPGLAPNGGALHAAASSGSIEIAKILLEYGADPNSEVESSSNCMGISKGNPKMQKLLASHGGKFADYENLEKVSNSLLEVVYGNNLPLQYYIDQGNLKVLNILIEKEPENCGLILKRAILNFNKHTRDIVTLCLQKNPNSSQCVNANQLIYMLHRLTEKQEKEMIKICRILLEAGMNPNDSDWLNVTSLHRLAIGSFDHGSDGTTYKSHIEIIKLFITAGANLEAIDEEYLSTPLGWAARWGRTEIVEELLKFGASTRNKFLPSWAIPMEWAKTRGNHDVVKILSRFEESRT